MNINMKKIAVLALTTACLAFTLPSVAANQNYHNQFKSPSVAYQQKNDVNDVMERVAKFEERVAKFDDKLVYIEKELHDMKYDRRAIR
ncbi:MAG: hypothetical protein V4471_03490 [Pseudomonadota bacterium]